MVKITADAKSIHHAQCMLSNETKSSVAQPLCSNKTISVYKHWSNSVNLFSDIYKGGKMIVHNPNLDLVNINVNTKFGQNMSICSQDIEQK